MKKTKTETWRRGFRIEYTGDTEVGYGHDWREFRWIEGPSKGETGWAPTEEQDVKNAEKRAMEHTRQQEGAAMLAKLYREAAK